jgi:hypothetical protein
MPAELGCARMVPVIFPLCCPFVTCSYESRWSGPLPTFCSPYMLWLAGDYFE